MTTKAANLSKEDQKYLTLIQEQLRQMEVVRAEMKETQAEINRLKATSRRKLARIDALLRRA
jgi:hypothetical protein